ncbi:MAG: hypothetical protein K2H50_04705 [Paramuribaculum sp.]|nr:hypothetical protein [Paramuribaculum sp.]
MLHSYHSRNVPGSQYIWTIMKIPGLSFSWKRAVGITKVKQKVSRATGIPTSRQGLERKVGALVIGALLGSAKKKKRR